MMVQTPGNGLISLITSKRGGTTTVGKSTTPTRIRRGRGMMTMAMIVVTRVLSVNAMEGAMDEVEEIVTMVMRGIMIEPMVAVKPTSSMRNAASTKTAIISGKIASSVLLEKSSKPIEPSSYMRAVIVQDGTRRPTRGESSMEKATVTPSSSSSSNSSSSSSFNLLNSKVPT
jgi:hypothetical protein